MYEIRKVLSLENILDIISEEDIFRNYIGKNFAVKKTICSPLRDDKFPSFTVFPGKNTKRKLMFKDHALNKSGSCFDLVMLLYNLTFQEALQVINNDFNLNLDSNINKIEYKKIIQQDFEYSKREYKIDKVKFDIKYREFNKKDIEFWISFGITDEILNKYNVKVAESYWMLKDNWKRLYRCINRKDTTYVYHFLKNKEIKLYRPFDKEMKWLSNCSSSTVQGAEQLPKKGNLLILTKSLKDVMALNYFNIIAVAPQSESIILSLNNIQLLRNRFPNILSFMDFDLTGVKAANRYRKLYGIEPLFLTNGRLGSKKYNAKDFSDYIKYNGQDMALKLIQSFELNNNKNDK